MTGYIYVHELPVLLLLLPLTQLLTALCYRLNTMSRLAICSPRSQSRPFVKSGPSQNDACKPQPVQSPLAQLLDIGKGQQIGLFFLLLWGNRDVLSIFKSICPRLGAPAQVICLSSNKV